MKIVKLQEFKNWILEQPDDRRIQMDCNLSYDVEEKGSCGCLMVQYAYDNNLLDETFKGSTWGCGFSEWEYDDENEIPIPFAKFERKARIDSIVKNVWDCKTFGDVKENLL